MLQRVVEPELKVVGGGDVTTFIVDEEAMGPEEAKAREYLDETVSRFRSRGGNVVTQLHRGRPATQILNSVNESNVDAIVMTTHGHTGPTRWLMGSVADEVFRNTDRPVLLISVRTVASRVTGGYEVRDLMTRDVEVVMENETVIATLRKLLRRRVAGAPVINASGELVGVITEHDLLAWHSRTLEALSKNESDLDPAAYGERIEADTIASVVSRPAIAIDADTSLTSAIRMMLDRKLRRLPVTDGGRLVGIISRADILKGMGEHWRSAKEAVDASSGQG